MKLVLATHNKDKIIEIKKAVKNLDIEVITNIELPEVIEDGKDLIENSLKKAREICEFTGLATLADDTGLEIEALNGAPGVYSARFAGENATYRDNVAKVLEDMKGKENRKADFKTVMSIVFPNGKELIAEGCTAGLITTEQVGDSGFGYDPIFFAIETNKTYAEMDLNEKNECSHRGKALREMHKLIKMDLGSSINE